MQTDFAETTVPVLACLSDLTRNKYAMYNVFV